ncbi:hypothetical protein LEP1GSC035_4608 [Leptospira noguchii str. 2007001578]|uniref:Uncharacterized protein n=1 Tax=Leptospira noguchii str. 2007001578 TaxID=1049974 RepID=A0ABN0J5T1_9LEPT|nr:hypothetical protein LEP1GSC035_4608 [Leptospira noguchii str. 2007001578]
MDCLSVITRFSGIVCTVLYVKGILPIWSFTVITPVIS